MNAIFVKSTKEILFSRYKHDCRVSSDNSATIDGGMEYTKVSGDPSNIIPLQLRKKVLLKQILYYDYMYQNSLSEEYPEGYYGRYVITKSSNVDFYKELVKNFKDIEMYFNE